MSNNPVKLNIAWLYPDILQGFCDEANVSAFYKRAMWRDIEVTVNKIKPNERISSLKYDFYYIGGSNQEALEVCSKYLLKNAQEIIVAAEAGVPMLAVNIGYMLFSSSWQFNDKKQTRGLDILSVNSIESRLQNTGSVIGSCPLLDNKTIVGFENHGMATYLNFDAAPFIRLKKGPGNNGQDKTEGAVRKNVIGTYISSPLLAQNPHLCDFLISCALKTKYKCNVPLSPLNDEIEWYSHNYIVETN